MNPSNPVEQGNSGQITTETETQTRRSVVVAAAIFALGTAASRVLGLVRDILTARYFSSDVRDAFLNAFRLPNLFRRIFGEGSLSVSFIPVFVEILMAEPVPQEATQRRARELVGGVFSVLLTLTLSLTLLAVIYMDGLMGLLLDGRAYMSVPGKFELTVQLGRIMFGFLILISLYGYFMAILNALGKFAITAVAPCLFNIVMISAALVSPKFAAPPVVLAISVMLGGILQMLVLVPSIVRAGYWPQWSFRWTSRDLLKVLRGILPSAFGMSVLQLTALVNMRFAAELPSGSHSYLYLADRILELPLSLFVVSLGSALLPTLARFWAEQNKQGMADTINHYIRLIVFISLPAAIGMFLMALPISEVLFLGREFKYADAVATASVIRIYALTVVISAGVRILAQGFYAIQNTWFPALAGSLALFSHVLFAFALTRAFHLEGLAGASVLSATVNLMMLAVAYNSWVGSLRLRELFHCFGQSLVCGLAMAISLQGYPIIQRFTAGRFFGARAASLLFIIVIGIFVYMLSAHLLGVREFHETWATFRAKLERRFRSSRASDS